MARRIILLIACLCNIFMLAASASAYGEGTIRVSLDPGDMAAIGGEVTVYYVGVPLEDGYRITEEFGGGMVKGEDALSPFLARWLTHTEGKVGVTQELDADGKTVFVGMPDGLYLLEQTQQAEGYYPMEPRMVSIPSNGERDVRIEQNAEPILPEESPRTGDRLNPAFSAMLMVLTGFVLVVFVGKRRKE